MPVEAIRYHEGALEIIDQTLLPGRHEIRRLETLDDVCEAIRALRIRGAPAIGVTAAYAFRMVAEQRVQAGETDPEALARELEATGRTLAATRPTARNLFMAVERLQAAAREPAATVQERVARVTAVANALHEEDRRLCQAIAAHGATLLPQRCRVLTHCNAGALATGGMGTALGVIYEAVRQGKQVEVYADETRPLWQGARLTAWELVRENVPVTVLCDNAAASLLATGEVDCVIVGADRIARNGDTANKVGTLAVALAARQYGVPFYVAAPSTTFDLSLASGAEIPIEQRSADEVLAPAGVRMAPEGAGAFNPAFDVTPAAWIAALIHEHGVVRPPFAETLVASLGAAVAGGPGPGGPAGGSGRG